MNDFENISLEVEFGLFQMVVYCQTGMKRNSLHLYCLDKYTFTRAWAEMYFLLFRSHSINVLFPYFDFQMVLAAINRVGFVARMWFLVSVAFQILI